MEFSFSNEQTMIAETAEAFFAAEATSARTRAAMADGGVDSALWQKFCTELGLAGIALPEAFGGAGLGLTDLAIIAEAAGRHLAAIPLLAGQGMVGPALLAGGTPAQQQAWLPRLAAGAIASWGRLDQGQIAGDRIAGTASLVPHGALAGLLLIASDDGLWLVETGAPGIAVEPWTTMDQTRPLSRVTFTDSPAEPLADSASALAALHRWGWVLIAADALGGAQACLEKTTAYALDRMQFGRTIGSFQAVKHQLADVAIDIEQARAAVYWAAATDGDGTDGAIAAHAAKAVASEAYSHAAAAMIQLHGGIGFTWEHDAHLYFKRARSDRSWLQPPEWHFDRVADLMALDAAA